MRTKDYVSTEPDKGTGLLFDLQRFAGEGEGETPPADTGFEFVDPKTKQKLTLPSKIGDVETKSLIEGIIAKSRTDAKAQLEKTYEPLMKEVNQYKETNTKLQEMLEKFENEKLTAEERAKKEQKRLEDEAKASVDKAVNEAQYFKSLFKSTVEQNEIFSAFSVRPDVHRPDQAYKLLKAEYPVEVVEEEVQGQKRWRTVVKFPDASGELEPLDPKVAVEKWLAMPDHAHFIKSNLQPGSGSSQTGGRRDASGALTYKRSQMHDPKVRAEVAAKMKAGENVSLVDD